MLFVDVDVYVDFFYLQCVKILLYSLYNLVFCINFLLILIYVSLAVGPLPRFCSVLFSVVCMQPVWVFSMFLSAFTVKLGGRGAAICKVHAMSQI
jgi:hypothetical protein